MEKEKKHMSIATLGHVDCGKSTTMGNLAYKLGGVHFKTIEKYEKESRQMGMESFKYSAERERGITIEIGHCKVETASRVYTIIDTPGHRDFIKNMINGTSEADSAILVVACGLGEFEAGISKEGQTKEHVLLAYAIGVKQMIVAINKMDLIEYNEARYEEVKEEIAKYLEKVGYKLENINFVPISGYIGDNLIEKSQNMPWYKGPTLVEAMDLLRQPKRPILNPLRIPIREVYRIGGIGTVAIGRVASGKLKGKMNLVIAPKGLKTICNSIEMHHESMEEAIPGDIIGFNLKSVSCKDIKRGFVAGDPNNDPPMDTESFTAYVIILNHPGEIKRGYTPLVYVHTEQVACKFDELISLNERNSGKKIEDFPKVLKAGNGANIRLVPTKKLCIESFSNYPLLGRIIIIRDLKMTVAVGVVQEVTKKECSSDESSLK